MDYFLNSQSSSKPSSKPTKKSSRKNVTKAEKFAVWNKYIGADKTEGKCYCCKQVTIHIMNFEAGHNKALAKGGKNDITNYRPICRLCNSPMGTMSIESYEKKLNPPKKSTAKKQLKSRNLDGPERKNEMTISIS